MPRRARITVAEVPVHIIQRGNNRSACFYGDDDYALYLAYLRDLAAKFECAVHADCLMTITCACCSRRAGSTVARC